VAGFIGQLRMNLLPCRAEAGTTELHGQGFTLPLPAGALDALHIGGGDLIVGFRPETVEVHSHAAAGSVPAKVDASHFQGDRLICLMRLGEEQIHASISARAHLSAGTTVWLAVPPDQLYLFDRASGRRLSESASALAKTSDAVA